MYKYFIFLLFLFLVSSCTWHNYPKYTQDPKAKNTYFQDSDITSHVKEALANDSILDAGKIHVATNGGVVHLSGQVQMQSEIARAIQLANQTQGVKLVESSLIVVPPLK